MTTLAQLLAVEKGVKTRAKETESTVYQRLGKIALFGGQLRTYKALADKDSDDEQQRQMRAAEALQRPDQFQKVQLKAQDITTLFTESLTRLIDITATKDAANTEASADLVLQDNGAILAHDVPVTTLILIEKQATDMRTFADHIPVLDPAQDWVFDPNRDVYASADPVKTLSNKKVPHNHVVAQATEQHAEQVKVYETEVPVGTWTTTDFSGALPAKKIADIKARADQLRVAAQFAREKANSRDVVDVKIGKPLLDFVFNGNVNGSSGDSPQVSG